DGQVLAVLIRRVGALAAADCLVPGAGRHQVLVRLVISYRRQGCRLGEASRRLQHPAERLAHDLTPAFAAHVPYSLAASSDSASLGGNHWACLTSMMPAVTASRSVPLTASPTALRTMSLSVGRTA